MNSLGNSQQAIGNQVKEILDPGGPAAPPEGIGPTMFAQIQAMQKALKDDQELVVLFQSRAETIRIVEFFAPSWQVAVLTGIRRQQECLPHRIAVRIATTGLQADEGRASARQTAAHQLHRSESVDSFFGLAAK